MMMRFVLASVLAVMMVAVVCAEAPGDLLLQRKKVSGSGFDKLFVTPEEGKALGWTGGTLGMLDVLAPDGDGSALTGITAGQVGALEDGDTLVQFLKFPNAGVRLLDASGDHALQLGFNEELTANRGLTFVVNDATRTVNLAGNLTVSAAATVSGTNTGDQTSVTGNAGTATRLATARAINGVDFDGTAPITVTVPVSTGITGLGTGVGTALGVNVGSAGSVVVNGGALGTPVSGDFSVGTFTWPTFNQNTTGTAANVSGVVGVGNGGTGLTSAGTAGYLLTSTGTGFVMAAPSGSGSGTVTSVTGTGTVSGLTLTGTVTSSGSLTLGGALSEVTLADKFTVNQGVPNANAIEVTGYSLTGSSAVSLMALSGTWNTSGTPTALNLNITDTASNAAANLAAFQVGGVTRVGFPKRGAVTFPDSSVVSISAPGVANWSGSLGLFGSSGGLIGTMGTNNFNLGSAVTLTLGGVSGPSLQFEANHVLGLRNAGNAQAILLERTFTSATNRETLAMGWRASPSLFLIQPVAGSGGGTVQDVGLARGGSITTGAVITDGTAQVYTTARGGIAGREAIRTVATNTTATVTDRTILVDAAAGSVTITLPAVSGLAGFRLNVKVLTTNAGANTVTVDPNASETVDGSSASLTSTTAYTSWQLHCDGVAWYLIK